MPPEGLAVRPPFEPPKHDALESRVMLTLTAVGSVIDTDAVSVHPFASVTVTVCVPAASEEAELVEVPLLHK